MTFRTGSLLTVALACAAAAAVFVLYPWTHPTAAIQPRLDEGGFLQRARVVEADLGGLPAMPMTEVSLALDRGLIEDAQWRLGIAESNRLLRDSLAGYFVDIRRYSTPESSVRLQGPGSTDAQVRAIADLMQGDVLFRFDLHGRLVRFEHQIADTMSLPSLSPGDAHARARRFLLRHASQLGFTADSVLLPDMINAAPGPLSLFTSRNSRPNREDYVFTWRGVTDGDSIVVEVELAGDRIVRYQCRRGPELTSAGGNLTAAIAKGAVILLIIVLVLIAGIRRLRNYEIGFRTGIMMGAVTAALMCVQLYFLISERMSAEIIAALLIAPLFLGGGMVLLWSVSEAVAREAWKDKFLGFDLFRRGHLLHSRVGAAILRGLAGGSTLLALWLLSLLAVDAVTPLTMLPDNVDDLRPLLGSAPLVAISAQQMLSAMFMATAALLFIGSLVKTRTRRRWTAVAAIGCVFTLSSPSNIEPFHAAVAIEIVPALLLGWLFVRTDILTGFIALLTWWVLSLAAALPGMPAMHPDAGFVLGLWYAGGLVLGLAGALTKDRPMDYDAITPAFARRISERQRLQRELEIARDVQMSFLPRTHPHIDGLDIAARCIPAHEVGGDYYDIIPLGPSRVGVVIGDVSGKGTQASFYMTLAKGFMRALATPERGPAELLIRMNTLFCDNVEPGRFISMLYAVFDMNTRTVRIARAGHNPLLVRGGDGSVRPVQVPGLALGVSRDDRFAEHIGEVTLPMQSGDVFLLYTDGCTEAMTTRRQEYGEERLTAAVGAAAHGTAESRLAGIFGDIRAFTGKAPQHDDMTAVLISVS